MNWVTMTVTFSDWRSERWLEDPWVLTIMGGDRVEHRYFGTQEEAVEEADSLL